MTQNGCGPASQLAYPRGVHQLDGGCFAWLEPPGGWGLANSGFLVADQGVLVVDTQNDMRLSAALADAVAKFGRGQPVTTVVNSHSDGDRWNGNLPEFSGRLTVEVGGRSVELIEVGPAPPPAT